jgi:hypothetical protein
MKHIKEQNWFAVGLDVIVVIVGIFLGMQVTEWNENNKNLYREEKVLQRLLAEFQEAEIYLSNVIQGTETRLEGNTKIVKLLRNSGEINDDEFKDIIGTTTGYAIPLKGSVTYTELVASGELNLLTSEELRSALVSYHQYLDGRTDAHNTRWEVGRYDNVTFAKVLILSEFKDINVIIQEDIELSDLQTLYGLTRLITEIELNNFRLTLEQVQEILDILESA